MPNLNSSQANPVDIPVASPPSTAAAPVRGPDSTLLVCANGVAVGHIEAKELTAIQRAAARDWTLYVAQLFAYVGGLGRCATRVFFLAAALAFWLIAIPLTLAPDVVLEAWRASDGAPDELVQVASIAAQVVILAALMAVVCAAMLSNHGIGVENLFEQRVFLRVRQKLGIAVSEPLSFVRPAALTAIDAPGIPVVQSEGLKVASNGSGANEGPDEGRPATKTDSTAGH